MYELDMKPNMHLVEIIIFSLDDVILIFKVFFSVENQWNPYDFYFGQYVLNFCADIV